MNPSSTNQNLPRGPYGWPIIGNALMMASASKFADFMEMEKQYGEVFRLYLGSQLAIIVSGSAIKEAFVTKAAEFAGRPGLYGAYLYTNCGQASNITVEDYSPRWNLLRKV